MGVVARSRRAALCLRLFIIIITSAGKPEFVASKYCRCHKRWLSNQASQRKQVEFHSTVWVASQHRLSCAGDSVNKLQFALLYQLNFSSLFSM